MGYVPGENWELSLDRASLALRNAVESLLSQPPELGVTLAIVVVRNGRIIAEGYGPGADAAATLISWSMAKSVTHAIYGLLVADGRIDLDAPLLLDEWADDSRSQITAQHLLNMRSGLTFVEDYVDAEVSHCIEMLFGTGQHDTAAFAAALPLEHPVDSFWNYASGTTNILARHAGRLVGGGVEGMTAYVRDRLFAPIGMSSASMRFDDAGTFIGSSFLYATARDFARFGLLYLRDGMWGSRRVLPAGWTDHARTPTPVPASEEYGYGAHWWLWPYPQSFAAHGYEGQRILVVPDRDLVVVRLGKTPADANPLLRRAIEEIVDAVPAE